MINIIFGITDLGESLYWLMKSEGTEVISFCVDKEYRNAQKHLDLPVLTPDELIKEFDGNEINIYICVGYNGMNDGRKKTYEALKKYSSFRFPNYVSKEAKVETNNIGVGNLFFEDVLVGAYTDIGNFNVFYPRSLLAHHSIIKNYNFFSISCSVAGDVMIGSNCFFGNNCTTKEKLKVADYTLLGASSYLSHNTKEYDVIVPVRSISLPHRSIDVL